MACIDRFDELFEGCFTTKARVQHLFTGDNFKMIKHVTKIEQN